MHFYGIKRERSWKYGQIEKKRADMCHHKGVLGQQDLPELLIFKVIRCNNLKLWQDGTIERRSSCTASLTESRSVFSIDCPHVLIAGWTKWSTFQSLVNDNLFLRLMIKMKVIQFLRIFHYIAVTWKQQHAAYSLCRWHADLMNRALLKISMETENKGKTGALKTQKKLVLNQLCCWVQLLDLSVLVLISVSDCFSTGVSPTYNDLFAQCTEISNRLHLKQIY